MSQVIGFVSDSNFEPKAAVDVSAVANNAYTTPAVLRKKLRSVANLAYKNATFAASLRLSAAASAGSVTVRLTDGSTDYASLVMDLTTGQQIGASQDVDLAAVAGSTALYVAVDVTTAAAGVTSIDMDAKLDLEMPTTVMGC